MPGRIRNTKKLGQRVDRTYLKKLFPIPLWRRILTVGCLLAGLAWLGIFAATKNHTPYTAGPLSTPHAFLGRNCGVCHAEASGMSKTTTDKQCGSCHDAPIHNVEAVSNPRCIDCHAEHRGLARLAGGSNRECAQCHADLKTKSGKLTVNAHITTFANHPEFAAVQAEHNPAGLKFNHAKHMDIGQTCAGCHPPADTSMGMAKPQPHSHVSSRSLMAIPTYAETCMPCHALNFDDKDTDAAPHDKPAVVDQFVKDSLTKYIAAHPGDLGKDGSPGSAGAWVKFKLDASEKKLWSTTCAQCHTVSAPDASSGLPSIAPSKEPVRWFMKASFDHAAHQALTCASCHPGAATSSNAADILLPGVAVCRNCHEPGNASAGDTCGTCHQYHDWSKEKGVDGKFKVTDMTRLLPAPGHGGAGSF